MPILKEPDLKKHLSSKQFSNLYFIDGEEKMLVGMYTDNLIKKIMGENPPEFNYHVFNSECEITDVSVACDVMPFMSDKNCVKLIDFDLENMSTDDIDALSEIAVNIPDTTVLIFSMNTVAPPQRPSKKYRKIRDVVEKNGIVADLSRRSALSLEKTLCKWASDCGSKISPVTASKLINTCSNDLNVLHSEIEKLSAYAGEEEITPQMIELLVAKNLQAKIYDLFDFVIAQNFDKAMQTIDVLFYQREEPVSIVIALSNAYVDMYRARIASESGINMKVMADELSYKNRAWVLDKMAKQSRRISTVAMRKSIDALLDLNERLVSVTVNPRTEIEKLISKLILIARGEKDA
ncbi:MAG: DNA polymerase III subunit delta [Ruminococcus sp.]|nr:DNA polymerase III subunit delta [Ruminococcus sp.]